MGVWRVSTVSLALSFILGCSPDHGDPPPPPKTVFDPLTQQMDRARGVQDTVDQHAIDTRKEIETQEHGDSSP
jgi:hypothetical protein